MRTRKYVNKEEAAKQLVQSCCIYITRSCAETLRGSRTQENKERSSKASLSAQKVNVSRDQLLESASKLPCECAEGGRNLLGALQKAYVLGKVHMAALRNCRRQGAKEMPVNPL
ncbi:hypothetical protein JTE90_009737 [Oedothorax gibbosus]|uniref:Uncharacterized protein n=1 Tax=Oedothorax gibbosus TaxID=931172 RepID=A0AAV6V9U2_9ARAC|nr:hypothetical protein JTE90_009737 [Oedothorax gibbosus]